MVDEEEVDVPKLKSLNKYMLKNVTAITIILSVFTGTIFLGPLEPQQ